MRVPDAIKKCVVFIGSTRRDGRESLRGTAFLLARKVQGSPNHWMNYFVTARHIIEGIRCRDEQPWIRVNMADGGVDQIVMKVDDWIVHDSDSSIDAAILWTAPGALSPFDCRSFAWEGIVTEELIAREGIGVGEDIFAVGLFVNHFGQQRNIPIVRVGNISAVPEEKVHSDFGDIDAYLIEARSIGGLSGSPVFVFLAPFKLKETPTTIEYAMTPRSSIFHLLGLIHGHYDSAASELDSVTEDAGDRQVREKLNVGIGVVVPMTRIAEIFDQDKVRAFEARVRSELARTENKN